MEKGINQHSDGSTTSLHAAIGKLFQIENIIAHVGFQLRDVSKILIVAANQLNIESVSIENLSLMDQMSTDELRRMSGIEHERRAVMDNWKALEEQKRQIIELAKARIEQGRAGQ